MCARHCPNHFAFITSINPGKPWSASHAECLCGSMVISSNLIKRQEGIDMLWTDTSDHCLADLLAMEVQPGHLLLHREQGGQCL